MTLKIARGLAPIVKSLANKIRLRFPKTRLFLAKGDREPNLYLLLVLDAPRDEYEVIRLVSDDLADIAAEHDFRILVVPFSKGQQPDIVLEGPEGKRLVIEIKTGSGSFPTP